jgi:hypothetical protein
MLARARKATGEARLAPERNLLRKVDPITGEPGKWVEGERVADGCVVVVMLGNASGAKVPY